MFKCNFFLSFGRPLQLLLVTLNLMFISYCIYIYKEISEKFTWVFFGSLHHLTKVMLGHKSQDIKTAGSWHIYVMWNEAYVLYLVQQLQLWCPTQAVGADDSGHHSQLPGGQTGWQNNCFPQHDTHSPKSGCFGFSHDTSLFCHTVCLHGLFSPPFNWCRVCWFLLTVCQAPTLLAATPGKDRYTAAVGVSTIVVMIRLLAIIHSLVVKSTAVVIKTISLA